jgi:hypothetical protein
LTEIIDMSLTVETGTDNEGHATFAVPNSVARLRFFLGQLLTQRDLQEEQRFHLVLQRLLQREAFGTGTVAGLGVATRAGISPRSVVISPGLAMDPDGRELLLEKEVAIDVADASRAAGTPFAGPHDTISDLRTAVVQRFKFQTVTPAFSNGDLNRLAQKLHDLGLITDTELTSFNTGTGLTNHHVTHLLEFIPPQPTLPPLPPAQPDPPGTPLPGTVVWILGQLVGETFVGLRFRELGIDLAPSTQDPSCCARSVCVPSRIQEGVTIVLSPTPFPDVSDPFKTFTVCLQGPFTDPVDCHRALCACLKASWRGLPKTDDPCSQEDFPVVPIARVLWNRFEQPDSQIFAVDDCSWLPLAGTSDGKPLDRPLAPGGPAVHALLEVLTGCQGVVT